VLSVQEARRQATQLYAQSKLGIDPAAQKDQAKADAPDTVKAKLPLYLASQQARVRNGHFRQSSYIEIERHLLLHAKRLHAKTLAEVTRRDIASVLSALSEKLSGATVNRVHSSLQNFFGWCLSEGLLDASPVAGTARREEKARTRLLTETELREIWTALRNDTYGDIVRLLILSGSRREEIGGLRVRELDLKTRTITLPPERTKNKRTHEIYLSDTALQILRDRPPLINSDGTPLPTIFGRGAVGFNDWNGSKRDLDRRINEARQAAGAEPMPDWTLHDFRRFVSTTMNETLAIQPHIVEEALGHRGEHKKGPAGVYNLSTYRGERAAALIPWGDYVGAIVDGCEQKVVPLRGAS
jgi:integrase